MGNYCCTNINESRLQEIEEDRRSRIKLSEDLFEKENISIDSFSIKSQTPHSTSYLHSIARRYLTLQSLSQLKSLASNPQIIKVLTTPLPVQSEIIRLEERIPLFTQVLNSSIKLFYPILLQTGDVYEGQWDLQSQKQNGFGSMIHKDHSKYVGNFNQGRKSGKGRLISLNGEVYEGEFKNDLPEGNGVLCKSNGLVYRGVLKKGKEHGTGIIEFEGEVLYKGNFLYGAKDGYGELNISDGNSYCGEFVNNVMEGRGKYVWNDGKVYDGTWKANKMHGEGKYTWPDGREYFGCYCAGNRDGFGIFKWPDGREYKGEWRKGNMHGVGIYSCVDKDGNVLTIKAEWDNGKKKKVFNRGF
jgi:hypothetical protein